MLDSNKIKIEEDFHDAWAASVNPDLIDVIKSNEACTAPEMRFITQILTPLQGRSLLDIGCGLGEASVYFAIKGAKVTSLDLSEGMLRCTQLLAQKNGVQLETHQASADDFDLADRQFDLIYVGNLFHHVDIQDTLMKIKKHLKPEGMLLSWDPLIYNPMINIYRKIATETRTPSERPFSKKDIAIFQKHFSQVNIKFFWLLTLFIFVLMFVFQWRNPNKERYWKKVVDECEKWKWLYTPLEKLDRIILKFFPFLGWYCWNIVIQASGPIQTDPNQPQQKNKSHDQNGTRMP